MTFTERLEALGFESYRSYLRSQHWCDFKRKYTLSSQPQFCLVCGLAGVELHHTTYKRLGGERLTDVVPLCRHHHEAVHEWLREARRPLHETMAAVAALRVRVVPPAPARAKVIEHPRKTKKKKRPAGKRVDVVAWREKKRQPQERPKKKPKGRDRSLKSFKEGISGPREAMPELVRRVEVDLSKQGLKAQRARMQLLLQGGVR